MANTARGNFQGTQHQYSAYQAGQYYPETQQQQQYQYPYQAYYAQPYGVVAPQSTSALPRQPPPPPPPPPGETTATQSPITPGMSPAAIAVTTAASSGVFPPLETPPLPPLFPWMSPALAQSMTGSQYGEKFKEEATNLPFVPIVVNDADLAKMTEKVMKEQEEIANQQMKFYKDVISQDLPKPLLDLFQPLYCKLCTLTLSSPIVSKDHYNGKRHKKAIENWFSQHPEHVTYGKAQQEPGSIKPLMNGSTNLSQNVPLASTTTQPTPLMSLNYAPPGPIQAGSNIQQNDRKRHAPSTFQSQGPPPPKHVGPNVQQHQIRPANSNIPGTFQNQNDHGTAGWAENQHKSFGSTRFQAPQQIPNSNVQGNFNQNGDFQRNKKPKWETPAASSSGPPPPRQRGGSGGGGPPPKQICEICNVQLSSKVMAEQHFRGKNHAARLQALQEGQDGSNGTLVPPNANLKPTIGPVLPPAIAKSQQPSISHTPASSSRSDNNFSSSTPPTQAQSQSQIFNNSTTINSNSFTNNKSTGSLPSHTHRGGGGGPSGVGRGNDPGGGGRGIRHAFKNANNNNSNNFQNNSNNKFGNNNRRGAGNSRFK